MNSKVKRALTWPLRCSKGFWRWYKHQYKGRPWWRKLITGFLSFIFFILFYCFAVQFNLFWLFGSSPSLNEIMHPKTMAASEVYSADGELLHKYFNENRSPVKYEEISPYFIDALISTEDERFYKHHGVDIVGLFAALKDATQGHARGASTITQQLVKNTHNMRRRKNGLLGMIPGVNIFITKSKEMIIATELEMFCSKEEILTMYVNTVDFGSNAFGIKTAARTYFNTTPDKLKVEEAAVLVGLLKATTAYNPKINPENSIKRRNVVIDNMVSHGKLTRAEGDSIKRLPLDLNFQKETALDGKALYFRQAVLNELKVVAPDVDPYIDGLKIYTTLDSRMQNYAEEAVNQQMRTLQKNFESHWAGQDPWVDSQNRPIPGFVEDKIRQTDVYRYLSTKYPDDPQHVDSLLRAPHKVKLFSYDGPKEAYMSSMDSLRYMLHFMHTAFVAIEPQTGDVKAYVGDVDFKTWQHDNASSSHQPGSTFKYFVYATAMKQGLVPADIRRDEAIDMVVTGSDGKPTHWRPHNANGGATGARMSLRTAFARSVNTVAIKLGQEVGINNVIETARDMGVKSQLDNAPSLALGSCNVTPLEIIGAYTAVANYGTFVEPHVITRIEDADGKIIYSASPKSRNVLTEKAAYYMLTLLSAGVTDGGGTSQSLATEQHIGPWYWNKKISAGGKTGTTNSHADAWFVGVTPNLVVGAWVGGQYPQIHFRTGALGQGSRTALPICGLFLHKVLSDKRLASKYLATFRQPSGISDSSLGSGGHYQVDEAIDSLSFPEFDFDGDFDALLRDDESDDEVPVENSANGAGPAATPASSEVPDAGN